MSHPARPARGTNFERLTSRSHITVRRGRQMRNKPSTYKEIHGSRPPFARSLGTRSKLQASGLQACSDQALAFAIANAGGGPERSSARQQIANQLADASNRKQDERRLAAQELEHAALSASLVLSMAGTGAHTLETSYEQSLRRQTSPDPRATRFESFHHSVQSRDSLEMTSDSLFETENDHRVGWHADSDQGPGSLGTSTPSKGLPVAFSEARPGASSHSLAHQDAVQQIMGAPARSLAAQALERSQFLLPEPPSPEIPTSFPTPAHGHPQMQDSSWAKSLARADAADATGTHTLLQGAQLSGRAPDDDLGWPNDPRALLLRAEHVSDALQAAAGGAYSQHSDARIDRTVTGHDLLSERAPRSSTPPWQARGYSNASPSYTAASSAHTASQGLSRACQHQAQMPDLDLSAVQLSAHLGRQEF